MYPMQAGDVQSTWADVDELIKDYDYKPNTPIKKGLREFIKWYKMFTLKKNNYSTTQK